MTSIEIDVSECRKFFDLVGKAANGGFKKEFETFLTAIGEDFLRIVSEEIIAREVVDTRILLSTFRKGSFDNVWILDEGEMFMPEKYYWHLGEAILGRILFSEYGVYCQKVDFLNSTF